jgi:glycosyltransferase involved in cell wall biosynthesis
MKIGIACTNVLPVPVPAGEIYANQQLAGELADRLADRGYDVTLFAPEGSVTRAKLVTFGMLPYSDPAIWGHFTSDLSFSDYEHLFMAKIYRHVAEHRFDLVHMHLRPLSVAPFAAMSDVPTLQTIHDPLTFPYFRMLEKYQEFTQLGLVSLSFAQRRAMPELKMFANVYNGIDPDRWQFSPEGGDHFCWSGRCIREKAPHHAIELAHRAGRRIELAGFVYEGDKHNAGSYWNREVRPLLGEDARLDYVAPENLSAFYGRAKALINPLEWEEPFGLVMIEAMACGTPVVAYNRGSVAEVVKDGVTGFVVDTEEEMLQALRNIDSISRSECRRHVEENFSLDRMAQDYAAAYERLIAANNHDLSYINIKDKPDADRAVGIAPGECAA